MDPNLLRNLGYFSVPNNQTLNPVDQPGSASGLGSSQPQSPSIWDDSALTAAGLGRSKDGSLSGPSSISLDSLAGSTPGSSFNLFSPSMSSSSLFSQNPRSIISSRNPRRDGHEKKRSRLSSESTPFDSVDYWIQFDEEQQLQQQQKQFEQQQQRFQLQQRQLQQQQQQAQQRQRQQQKQQQQQAQQQQGQQQTPDGEEKESGEKEEDEDERQEQQQQQQQPPPPPPPPQQQSQQQSQPQPQPQDVLDEADLGSMGTATQAKVPTPQRSTTMTTSQTSSGHKRREDSFDDSALEKALSDDGFSYSSLNLADQLSKIDTMPPPEIPPREGLYSTPLSWERPQMGLRLDSLMGLQTPSLSEDEQRRLIAIAMNTGGAMSGLGPSMNPNFGFQGGFLGAGLGQSPMGQFNASSLMNPMMMGSSGTPSSTLPSPSIKPSKMDKGKQKEMERERDKPKSADRTAHNDIERKYRTNLKDRIAELRDAVPALRTIPESALDDADDSTQPGRGPKVSKGTVLTKATDYIHYLEKKNKAIMQQHQELSRRLQAFEQLLSAAAQPSFQMPYSRTLFDPRAFC